MEASNEPELSPALFLYAACLTIYYTCLVCLQANRSQTFYLCWLSMGRSRQLHPWHLARCEGPLTRRRTTRQRPQRSQMPRRCSLPNPVEIACGPSVPCSGATSDGSGKLSATKFGETSKRNDQEGRRRSGIEKLLPSTRKKCRGRPPPAEERLPSHHAVKKQQSGLCGTTAQHTWSQKGLPNAPHL